MTILPTILIGLVVKVRVPPETELLVRVKFPVPVMPPLIVIVPDNIFAFVIVRLLPFKLIAPL